MSWGLVIAVVLVYVGGSVGESMPKHAYGSQRTALGNRFSTYTIWILSRKPSSLGLVASAFTFRAILLAKAP